MNGGGTAGVARTDRASPVNASGNFVSKKDFVRLRREAADWESKARAESQARQERIKVLWGAITSGELAQDTKDLADKELVRSLIELVQLQKSEIEHLTEFRRELERIRDYDPEQLKNLSTASGIAVLQPFIEKQLAEEKPKTVWARKRGDYKWCGGVGLIEYDFGGAGEAEWRKSSLSGQLHKLVGGPPFQPTCLDEILAGGAVHRLNSEREVVFLGQGRCRILNPGLQLLFGMHRNRFPKNLRSCKNPRNRRERLYDYRDVTKIMEALLSESRPERKTLARGSPQQFWPRDPDLRTPVLRRIEARINSLSLPEQIKPHIKAEFLAVVHRHLHDSAKK